MGACFDRLQCEVFQNLFLSPMNTGFVRPAVATVLTVYGIETHRHLRSSLRGGVATVLTVYGIETGAANSPTYVLSFCACCNSTYRLRY